jgi:hypothetical protein
MDASTFLFETGISPACLVFCVCLMHHYIYIYIYTSLFTSTPWKLFEVAHVEPRKGTNSCISALLKSCSSIKVGRSAPMEQGGTSCTHMHMNFLQLCESNFRFDGLLAWLVDWLTLRLLNDALSAAEAITQPMRTGHIRMVTVLVCFRYR